MTDVVEKLKWELATFTTRERAALTQFLIRSLDRDQDEDADAAWEAELTRRVAEIKSGKAVGKPAEQVFAELREKRS